MSDETKIFSNAPFDPNQKNEIEHAEGHPKVDNSKSQRLKAFLIAGLSAGAIGGGYLYWSKTMNEAEIDSSPTTHSNNFESPSSEPNFNGEEQADSTNFESEIPNATPVEDEIPNAISIEEGPEAIAAVHHSENIPIAIPIVYDDAPIATLVSDSMNFDQAFATARNEIGAGGFFEWKNEFYNTYYKEEWDSMTSDAQQNYLASIIDKIDHPSENSELNGPNDIDAIPVAIPLEENNETPDMNMEEEILDDSNTTIIEAGEEPYSNSFDDTPDMDNDADVSEWL